MSYSIDPISDGCYPGTSILVNKFDIRDEAKLQEVEGTIVSIRNAEWLSNPLSCSFDFEHYKQIHKHLFHDLYDWSGEIRTVNMSKKGAHFTTASDIEDQATRIFRRLKSLDYFKGLPHDEFVHEVVDFYCATNYLHPFREGNGRTQRLFITQLIRNAGYDIDFSEMDTDLLMIATIQSAQGVTDLLTQIFTESII